MLLRSIKPQPTTQLEELIGCIPYQGPAKALEEMDAAIATGIMAGYKAGK